MAEKTPSEVERKKLINFMIARTAEWAEENAEALAKKEPEPEKPKPVLSEKAEAIKDFIEKTSDFGCQTRNVAKLMALVIEEPIEVETRLITSPEAVSLTLPRIGTVVVPNANYNGHNYPLGEMALVSVSSAPHFALIRQDGSPGNNITYENDGNTGLRDHNELRPATVDEINAMPEAQLTAFYNAVVMLPEIE